MTNYIYLIGLLALIAAAIIYIKRPKLILTSEAYNLHMNSILSKIDSADNLKEVSDYYGELLTFYSRYKSIGREKVTNDATVMKLVADKKARQISRRFPQNN